MWVPGVIRMHPPILRRAQWCIYLGFGTVFVGVLLQGLMVDLLPQIRSFWIAVPTGLLVLLVGYGLISCGYYWLISMIPRAKAADHLICGECGHNLFGAGNVEKCSECGAGVDLDRLQHFWRRYALFNLSRSRAMRPVRWLTTLGRRVVVFSAASLLLAAGVIWLTDGVSGRLSHWGIYLFLLMMGLFKLFGDLLCRHVCRRVLAHDYCVCLLCGGLLREAGSQVECQSCRKGADLATVRAAWKELCPPCWDLEHQQ